jgi:hypothetical protein
MKNILIGTPIKNGEIFVDNLLNQINNLSYPKKYISLCFVENDSEDNTWKKLNESIKQILNVDEYRKVIILKLDLGFKLRHEDRHKFEYSKNRIKNLVVLRNFIVNNYLCDNDYIWWVDADIEEVPINSIEYLSSFDKDMLMPFYYSEWWKCYDCASYANVDNKIIKLDELSDLFPDKEIYKLNRCECSAFIKKRVFESGLRYSFIEEEYVDLCGNNIPCKLEGVSFSEQAFLNGFEIFGCLKFKIKHWQC